MNNRLLKNFLPTCMVVAITSFRIQAGSHFLMLNESIGSNHPVSPLIRGTDGALYGVSDFVFKLRPDGSGYQVLCQCGSGPTSYARQGPLLEASDGALYSVAGNAGAYASDAVYKLNKDGSGYREIFSFGPEVNSGILIPNGGLVEGADGALYLTSWAGGITNVNPYGFTGYGTIFKLRKDGSEFQVLHNFGATPNDGQLPVSGLLLANDGRLYGTTPGGGTNGAGIIFSLSTDGGNYQVLHHFGLPQDGSDPLGPLIQGRDGALYGMTAYGGASVNTNEGWGGTIFKLQTDGSNYQVLHNFGNRGDGFWPYSGLTQARDGALYGTTTRNVSLDDEDLLLGYGSIFRINPDGSHYSALQHFDIGGDPVYPMAGLVQGNDGAFYGTGSGSTIGGYSNGGVYNGNVFKLWPPETPELTEFAIFLNYPQVTFAGVSGESYELLRSSDLTHWNVLTNVVMSASGLYRHTDQTASGPGAFYRAAWVP
jgi:uncharacterized repeat protein (TIGR03803 family)